MASKIGNSGYQPDAFISNKIINSVFRHPCTPKEIELLCKINQSSTLYSLKCNKLSLNVGKSLYIVLNPKMKFSTLTLIT